MIKIHLPTKIIKHLREIVCHKENIDNLKNTIRVIDGRIEAAAPFMLTICKIDHPIDCNTNEPLHNGVYTVEMIDKDACIIETKDNNIYYPNLLDVLPNNSRNNKPIAEVFLNKRYLMQLLKDAGDEVKLTIYGNTEPIEVQSCIDEEENIHLYSILMPLRYGKVEYWKPY